VKIHKNPSSLISYKHNNNIKMTSATTKPTVAIFGATGGTGLSVLKNCLAAGHAVNVLARTPSKLTSLSSQYPNLHIIQGDIHSIPSVKETLLTPSSTANRNERAVVDVVVSGIGMVLQRKGIHFTSADTSICETGTHNILAALSELESSSLAPVIPTGGPKLVLLSTTGISSKSRDVPIAMLPLYHWLLAVPHAD
jgi:nucleoside-diphosphate-sugar epimerase